MWESNYDPVDCNVGPLYSTSMAANLISKPLSIVNGLAAHERQKWRLLLWSSTNLREARDQNQVLSFQGDEVEI